MSMPNLRFAVVTDLHVGSDTSGGWHNRFLSDDPAATVRAAVAAINRDAPDFTLVLGDLADHGTAEELAAARAALDGLRAPWLALRGLSARAARPDADRCRDDRPAAAVRRGHGADVRGALGDG